MSEMACLRCRKVGPGLYVTHRGVFCEKCREIGRAEASEAAALAETHRQIQAAMDADPEFAALAARPLREEPDMNEAAAPGETALRFTDGRYRLTVEACGDSELELAERIKESLKHWVGGWTKRRFWATYEHWGWLLTERGVAAVPTEPSGFAAGYAAARADAVAACRKRAAIWQSASEPDNADTAMYLAVQIEALRPSGEAAQ